MKTVTCERGLRILWGQLSAKFLTKIKSGRIYTGDLRMKIVTCVEKLHILWEQLSAKFLIKIKLGRIYTG